MKDHRSPLNRTSYTNGESKESSTSYVEDTLFVPLVLHYIKQRTIVIYWDRNAERRWAGIALYAGGEETDTLFNISMKKSLRTHLVFLNGV